MRNILILYIEVVYAVLQHPAELPVYLRKIPALRVHIGVSLFIASLSSALGVYTLRDYYRETFYVGVLFMTVNHYLMFLLWGLLFGSLVDALVRLKHPDRAGQTWQMISIALLSCMPFFFMLPLAVPAKTFLREPLWLFLPLAIGLYIWSMIIALKGLQYLYEYTMRDALRTFMSAAGLVLVFPAVFGMFFVLEIYQLLS